MGKGEWRAADALLESPFFVVSLQSKSHAPIGLSISPGYAEEAYSHLVVLFSRVYAPKCHACGQAITPVEVRLI